MEFLALYARLVHSNQYYRSALLNSPGATFVDIITTSDITYAITLIKNNHHVWTQQYEIAGQDKTQAVPWQGRARSTFGNLTWNDEGK